mgnify:CR=1 FL=1
MKTDLEIAYENEMELITKVAEEANISDEYLEAYGKYKAKISLDIFDSLKEKKDGKVILVTAINPTKAGEGKSTTTIGLADALAHIGKKSMVALREPSFGPVLGIKGGAAGGGYAQVQPMEDINMHFTGDMHAITTANNAISAIIDNHLHQGNELNINPEKIVWKRCLDLNDRALREVTVGQGPKSNGVERKDGFNITVASEIMAILCLATSVENLKERIANIVVAYNMNDEPVKVGDLGCQGVITLILKDAIKPNLCQTLYHTPALIHGGPFANIAHGCNSIIATKMAMKLADYVVTEAGFGADLGAEKFLDIKCQRAGIAPDVIVLVATVRALKLHGGVKFEDLDKENIEAMLAGTCNLQQHAENMRKYGVPVIVTANRFPSDTDAEIDTLRAWCDKQGYDFALNEGAIKGSEGAEELAGKVAWLLGKTAADFKPLYPIGDKGWSIKDKIGKICHEIYRADYVEYTDLALEQIRKYEEMGYRDLAVCMAKTPSSFSDDAKLLGAPRNFAITVREVRLSAGAGLIVPLTGAVMTMPGLPKNPLACKM